MKNKLYLNILTNATLLSREDGKQLFEIWKDEFPGTFPERYGNYEPLRSPFELGRLDTILDFWKYPFLVRRTRPKMSASIFMGGGKIPTHGWLHIVTDFSERQQDDAVSFVQKISTTFDVDFAFIHLLTKNEFPAKAFSTGVFTVRNDASMNTLSVTTHELKKNVPDLYWGTFFGPAYFKLFGDEKFRLLNEYCYVKELKKGLFYLQVTEKISDLESNFELFDSRRKQIKNILNSNAFFDPKRELSHRYSVPNFVFHDQ